MSESGSKWLDLDRNGRWWLDLSGSWLDFIRSAKWQQLHVAVV